MKKIFKDAKDKNVGKYVVYGDSTDNKLYYTTDENKEQVTEEDLNDAFVRGGLVIVVGDATFVPVSVEANVAKTVDTVSSAVALVEWAAKAKA
jgi:hypothetical protein